MKIRVSKSGLLQGLQVVQNVVNIRSTLPVLSNVLMNAVDGKLWLTTTNLEVSIRCAIEAEVEVEGATTLPVRRLSSIVRELPDAAIELESDGDDVSSLTCGSSFFKVIGLPQEEFPKIKEPEDQFAYQLEQKVFKEMLKKTAYAASTDETRYVLNGVLLSFKEGKLTMVATDGRRLALIENEVEIPSDAETDLILPSKTVVELTHTLKDEGSLRIQAQGNQIVFHYGDVMVFSKVIEGTYPNFRQVIPSQCEERVAVEREVLLTALKRAALLTTDKSNATKLTFADNRLTITTSTPEIGEARETIAIKYGGKEISVAFNPDYMMDPLRYLYSDEIYVELTDDLSPGVIKSDIPFLYVLMPMRIS